MAINSPPWPYWYAAFPAQIFEPLSPDGELIVVFGQAIGLALIGVVSDSVTHNSKYIDKNKPEALLAGYRAGFWTCTGWMVLTCVIGALGLQKSGKVGLTRD